MRDRQAPILFAQNDLLLTLLACLLVAVMFIADVKKDSSPADARATGNISVYVFWRDGIDLDIDTHVRGPGDSHVFFAHPSGAVWSLLRDDLGKINDGTDRNFENAATRGLPPGEYVINVGAYRGAPELYPAEVSIEVRVKAHPERGGTPDLILAKTVVLDRTGEEVTAFRFVTDSDGRVRPETINAIYQPIWGNR